MVIELGDSHCRLKFGNFPILRCLNLWILCFFHGMFSSILLPSLYFPIFSLECLVKVLGSSNPFIQMGQAILDLFHDIPLCKGLGSLMGPLVLIPRHFVARSFLRPLLANSTKTWIQVLNLRLSLHSLRLNFLGFGPYLLAQSVKTWASTKSRCNDYVKLPSLEYKLHEYKV